MESSGRGVMLYGSAGVGKSRLARHIAEGWTERGGAVIEAIASRATSRMVLGAFSQHLPRPASDAPDPAALLMTARRALVTDGAETLIYVDDAQLMDDTSAALVTHLARDPQARVLLTVRDDEVIPEAVTRLWQEDLAERIELAPLDREAVEALTRIALGGPVSATTRRELYRVCEGNPFVLREIVTHSMQAGSLVYDDGVWIHREAFSGSPRLWEVVRARLETLTDQELHALEVVAVAGWIGLTALERLVDIAVIARLEREGLLRTSRSGRRVQVRLMHPAYGEALRSEIPESAARAVNADLARALEETGMRRRDDLLRAATWALDAGGSVATEVLVEAAKRAQATFDGAAAERFARAALDANPGSVEAKIALGAALVTRGDIGEGHDLLEGAMKDATEDETRAWAASASAEAMFMLGGADRAITRLSAVAPLVESSEWRGVLSAQTARYLVFTQDLDSALQQLDRIGQEGGQSDNVVLSSLLASSIARALGGRPAAALDEVAQAEAIIERIPDAFPTAATQLDVTRGFALLLQGNAREALLAVERPYVKAAKSEVAHDALGSLAAVYGHALLLGGRPRQAQSVLEEAVEELVVRDQLGLLPLSIAGLAEAAGLTGDDEVGRRALDRLAQLPERLQRYYGSLVERSRGLALHYRGDVSGGLEALHSAARRARIAGRHSASVLALLDLARLGEAAAAHDALEEVAAQGDELWLVEHARVFAWATREAKHDVLASVGRDFAERGFELIGAESMARAAIVAESGGNSAAAFTYTVACDNLIAGCEVETQVTKARPEVLTDRERQIADRVAVGRSNAEIAGELVLSARTIESHLGRIYKRLGIDGREALTKLMEANGR